MVKDGNKGAATESLPILTPIPKVSVLFINKNVGVFFFKSFLEPLLLDEF